MNILDKIVAHKVREVAECKHRMPVSELQHRHYFSAPTVSLKQAVSADGQSGIIAEIKRKSPSRGMIHPDISVENVARGYATAGASAISVLTDFEFFGGRSEELTAVREVVTCPLLRKDFTIDEYQIVEAKAIGADAILLIASILSAAQVRQFSAVAHSLGLEVLLEVHSLEEWLPHVDADVDLVGVNNRDLKTFEVSLDVSRQLASLIPAHRLKVSESGISATASILELRQLGYRGFLMGENFMKEPDPGVAASHFIRELNSSR